ncbi:MAG: hypothetical protein JETT_2955 [Candidatus Jettenia ecosi]|uniref:Uncharacterized protein n=1 Tax=Candidatus Jettenia ecosi TaxID=2494326 RepID=A0A533Q803_9BACT|nr:MAG: hypothetical protein JETT_2955 [Candidatus Jettenia ecosi]
MAGSNGGSRFGVLYATGISSEKDSEIISPLMVQSINQPLKNSSSA